MSLDTLATCKGYGLQLKWHFQLKQPHTSVLCRFDLLLGNNTIGEITDLLRAWRCKLQRLVIQW